MRPSDAVAAGVARRLAVAMLLVAATMLAIAAPSQAAIGYEPAATPFRALDSGEVVHGIAVDQASQRIYLAIAATNSTGAPGHVERFESNLSSAGVFADDGGYYTGIAVNPVTQAFYAAQARVHLSGQVAGVARMDPFSSTGVAGTTFALDDTETLPQIATDSSGLIYFPNALKNKVQVFNSAGVLQKEIACTGCPVSTSFDRPVSVALDASDNLYVVDLALDRVVKLNLSGGSYSFGSVVQSGRDAAAVAVDPADGTIFIGNLPDGREYHVTAYDSAGVQFDDFASGMFTDPDPQLGALIAPQIAVNATTRRVYVGDANKFHIFDRVTAQSPTATILSATNVGQITATLRASANPKGHTALECEFEYTDDADFQANGFDDALALPCAKKPIGSTNTVVEAKVSNLSPSTVYHYRYTTTTFPGSVTTTGQTFETLPSVQPSVTTDPATGLAETSATLRGKVNPHGGTVTSCYFEYGTSTSYGQKSFCTGQVGSVTTDVALSRTLSTLAPGTTYHYRLVVTTNAGTKNGQDVVFTTSSPPPPPPPPPPPEEAPLATPAIPPAPPPVVTPPKRRPLTCRKGFRKKRVRGKLRCVKKKKRRAAQRRRAQAGRR